MDALDYGDPDGAGSRDTEFSRGTDNGFGAGLSSGQGSYDNDSSMGGHDRALFDDAMDAEMRAWEENYDGLPDEFDTRRDAKLAELSAARKHGGARFYALPRDEAVRAGARRGVTSSAAGDLTEQQLMGSAEAADEGMAPPEMPGTIGQGLDVRYSVLHLRGLPITQCSTSRLFAYVTHFGAQPLGMEWVDDRSCNIVFSDANAARIAIEYLCPPASMSTEPLIPLPTDRDLDEAVQIKRMHDTGEDTERTQAYEWPSVLMQSLLMPRKAHRFPAKLYNAPERDAAMEMAEQDTSAATSALPDDVPEIYREMEIEDRRRRLNNPKQKGLANLRSNLWVRWAVESLDVKGSDAARRSKWYREHGRDAGRDVVPKVLAVGGASDRLELLPGQSKRGRRDRRAAPDSSAAMDAMDRELDTWREKEDDETLNDRYNERAPARGRNGRRRPRHNGGMDVLDEDLDMEAAYDQGGRGRSASPTARGSAATSAANGSQVRVRGRGRMRAPSAWDDDDTQGSSGRNGRMLADDVERIEGRRRGRKGGRGGARYEPNDSLEDRMRPSLASRFGPASLNDRMG